ncbi:sorting nexin-10A [Aplochiton taeniatus]
MDVLDGLVKTEFVSVWVQNPQFHREDFWHTYVDYEICLKTNSMCFRRKTSCVRRQYSEFVWLRQRLQDNAHLIDLPKLPSWNPFFSLNNPEQVNQRMRGLQEFLEIVIQTPFLLSDSRLHLFLQSQLTIVKMESCVAGRTRYTVAQAIQRYGNGTRTSLPLDDRGRTSYDSDCESTTSSSLSVSLDTILRDNPLPFCQTTSRGAPVFSCLAKCPSEEQHFEP